MAKEKIEINNNDLLEIINKKGIFNLQFRKEIKHNRPGKPTYHRWIAQFIVVFNKDSREKAEMIKKYLNCGKIYQEKNQTRYTIQNIDDLANIFLPFLEKIIKGKEESEINLWIKAVKIIFSEKRKQLPSWNKKNLKDIVNIYEKIRKNKRKKGIEEEWKKITRHFSAEKDI